MKTQSCGLGPADSRVSQMFAGPVCLGWTDQSGMWGGEEMVDISENLACSGLLAIFPIWGCSSFQKSWQELMVCPESRIWSRSKLCEEQLSCSPSQARGRLQPVQTMTPRPWPWLSLSCPTQDAPADRWFTGQGVLGQGEQGWSSLLGGKSSALHGRDSNGPSTSQGMQSCHCRGLWCSLPGRMGVTRLQSVLTSQSFPVFLGEGWLSCTDWLQLWMQGYIQLRVILSIVRALGAQKGFSTPRQHREVKESWIRKGCELCWKTRQRSGHRFWGRPNIWRDKEIRNNDEVAA